MEDKYNRNDGFAVDAIDKEWKTKERRRNISVIVLIIIVAIIAAAVLYMHPSLLSKPEPTTQLSVIDDNDAAIEPTPMLKPKPTITPMPQQSNTDYSMMETSTRMP